MDVLKISSKGLASLPSDLSPDVKTLRCYNNKISSLKGLNRVTALTKLEASRNPLATLDGIQGLAYLRFFDVHECVLTSLAAISQLRSLHTLLFYNNDITDLQPLARLNKLTYLSCGGNWVTSLEPLSTLKDLQVLSFNDNLVTSLEPLSLLPRLRDVECAHNPIETFFPLTSIDSLSSIFISSEQQALVEDLCEERPELKSEVSNQIPRSRDVRRLIPNDRSLNRIAETNEQNSSKDSTTTCGYLFTIFDVILFLTNHSSASTPAAAAPDFIPLFSLLSSLGLSKYKSAFERELITLPIAAKLDMSQLLKLGLPPAACKTFLDAFAPATEGDSNVVLGSVPPELEVLRAAAASIHAEEDLCSLPRPRQLPRMATATLAAAGMSAESLPPSLQSLSRHFVSFDSLERHERLGGGDFGDVYRVTNKNDGVVHAAKVAKTTAREMDEEARKEFVREIEVLSSLKSPFIVQFTGVSINLQNQLILLNEFMGGGGLDHWLYNKKHSFSSTIKLRLCTEIACGISYLHSRGVLHRDLKSDNVLLDEDGVHAKVAGLGLAMIRLTASVYSRSHVGTVMYLAPEILQPYNESADAYAYALVVFEVYTSTRPYAAALARDIDSMKAHVVDQKKRPDLSCCCSSMPQGLPSLVAECWAGEASRRPSMQEVVNRLRSFSP